MIIKDENYWEYEADVYVDEGETTYVSRTLPSLPVPCVQSDVNCDTKVNGSDPIFLKDNYWNTILTQPQIDSITCVNLKNFFNNYYFIGDDVRIRNIQVVAAKIGYC